MTVIGTAGSLRYFGAWIDETIRTDRPDAHARDQRARQRHVAAERRDDAPHAAPAATTASDDSDEDAEAAAPVEGSAERADAPASAPSDDPDRNPLLDAEAEDREPALPAFVRSYIMSVRAQHGAQDDDLGVKMIRAPEPHDLWGTGASVGDFDPRKLFLPDVYIFRPRLLMPRKPGTRDRERLLCASCQQPLQQHGASQFARLR